MAIEQFGESLLTQKRQRDEEQEKKLRKREDRNALLGLAGTVGIGLYRKNLKEKQQNFFNSQPVMDMKIKYNQAQRIADDTEAERQRVMSFGGSHEDYYYDKAFKDIKSEYLTRYSDDLDRVAYINAGKYDAAIAKDARAIYKEQLDAQLAREQWADRFKAQGSFEDVLSMSNQRPTSAFDGLLNFLRGKSDQELDRRTIQAMRQSSLGRVALPASPEKQSEAQRLEEAYRITNNIIEAQDVADLGELERDTRKEVTYTGGFNSTTGKYDYRKQIKQFDKVTGEELDTVFDRIETADMNDQAAMDIIALKNLRTSYNPVARSTTVFNKPGEREFFRRLREANKDIKLDTLAKYNTAMDIFYDVMQAETDDNGNPVDYLTVPSQKFNAIQEAVIQSVGYRNRFAIINEKIFGASATEDSINEGRNEYLQIMEEIAKLGKL